MNELDREENLVSVRNSAQRSDLAQNSDLAQHAEAERAEQALNQSDAAAAASRNEAAGLAQQALRRQQELAFKDGYYPDTRQRARLLSERGGASMVSAFRTGGASAGVASRGREESHNGIAVSKSGTGPSRYDPQPLERVLGGIVNKLGWQTTLTAASIAARWPEIVGPAVAAHCEIETFEKNVLIVRTSSTAWANQMKLLLPTLEKQIAKAFGNNAIKQVIIRGPQAPSWRKGRYHVPGRGPRDTYG